VPVREVPRAETPVVSLFLVGFSVWSTVPAKKFQLLRQGYPHRPTNSDKGPCCLSHCHCKKVHLSAKTTRTTNTTHFPRQQQSRCYYRSREDRQAREDVNQPSPSIRIGHGVCNKISQISSALWLAESHSPVSAMAGWTAACRVSNKCSAVQGGYRSAN
jgi:hypothetical protein